MTMHVVKRPFAWDVDGTGLRAEPVAPGDVRDFRDLAPGLLAEGYIATTGGPEHATADAEPHLAAGDELLIPSDWRDLSWPAKRKLAASVSDTPIRNGDDADAAIAAYLSR